MASRKSKPSAADRTVDMFLGKTRAEIEQSSREEVSDGIKELAIPIEQRVNGNRETAFRGQEWTSKHFPEGDGMGETAEFRWSIRENFLYLEQLRFGQGGKAYHYAGVMFPSSSLEAFIKATSAMYKGLKNAD